MDRSTEQILEEFINEARDVIDKALEETTKKMDESPSVATSAHWMGYSSGLWRGRDIMDTVYHLFKEKK